MKTVALALVDTLLWTLHSLETSTGGFRDGFTGEEMLQHCGAGEKNPVTDFGRGIRIASACVAKQPRPVSVSGYPFRSGIGKWIAH